MQPLALAMILSVARVSVSTGPVTRIGDVPGPQVRRRGVGPGAVMVHVHVMRNGGMGFCAQ